MIYVALLRGINVGGNNKVSMAQLKTSFEQAGMETVKTYINSGNVIFSDKVHSSDELTTMIEKIIVDEFGFSVSVLIRTINEIETIVEALPEPWRNDLAMKCDVLFLWKDIDREDIVDQLVIKPGVDNVRYVPGAILFAVDRKNITKSGLTRIIGTPMYKKITIRNCNTTRKLLEIMKLIET